MRRIWDTLPYWDEQDMLRLHLEEVGPYVHKVIITEARTTFRGDPKPLYFDHAAFAEWDDKIIHVVADIPETDSAWAREFAQRDAAWGALIDAGAELEDLVIIGDTDEIPSLGALSWRGWPVCALQMRTTLHAVDWIVPDWYRLPTQTVLATVRWLKSQHGQLAKVRQDRQPYPVLQNGGWHFSWTGGPEKMADKLVTGTSHTEIAGTLEDALIRSGLRYTQGANGPTGAPVEPAVVDETWPLMIRERRCPPEWFRPEGSERDWVRPASDDPAEIMDFLWSGWTTGELAFEVGANCGQSLDRLLRSYRRVVAFEPLPAAYRIAAHVTGADVRNAAVSDRDGEVTLTLENSQLLSSTHEGYARLGLEKNDTVTVPCVMLDTVMDAEGVPAFVNMDVEGHELSVLRGALRLLGKNRTQWLIEFHSQEQQEKCAKLLDDFGCDVQIVRHPHYAPGSQFYLQHGWLKAVPSAHN